MAVAAEPRSRSLDLDLRRQVLVIALFAAFEVYWPAIHGPFLLDDTHLPYMLPDACRHSFDAAGSADCVRC